jgi:hypothetical protein
MICSSAAVQVSVQIIDGGGKSKRIIHHEVVICIESIGKGKLGKLQFGAFEREKPHDIANLRSC